MGDLAPMMEEAEKELGNLSGLWNPFAIIDGKGLDGAAVFSPMLSRILVFGLSLLLLMALLRVAQLLFRSLSGRAEEDSILAVAAETTLVAAFLIAYPAWIRLFPEIFHLLGRAIQAYASADLSGQVSGALAQIGNERTGEFRLWSERVFALPVNSFVAALFSAVALVLLWVMAKLQAYLFTFWYLLGPVALPTLVFQPLSHVGRIWIGTFMGVSLISVTGPLMYAILVRSSWLAHAFAAGGELDALTCIVFSLLTILLIVSIPILSLKVWSGVESRVFSGASGAADAIGRGSALVQAAGTRAQSTYQAWRGQGPASQVPAGADNAKPQGERG